MTKHDARSITISISIMLSVAGCHRPNVEAIEQQLQTCGVAPLGPVCEGDEDDAAAARSINAERFAMRRITTIAKERCFLAVDCSDERVADEHDQIVNELISCVVDGDSVVGSTAEEPPDDDNDPEVDVIADCLSTCDEDLSTCGDGSPSCSDRTSIDACFDSQERCVDRCWNINT